MIPDSLSPSGYDVAGPFVGCGDYRVGPIFAPGGDRQSDVSLGRDST